MIIEIIILLGFLSSIIGFIFFTIHYFKTWKKKNDNRRMLLAIEKADDEYAGSDKFYEKVFDSIDFRKIVIYFLIVTVVAAGFIFFAAPNNPPFLDSSIGSQGVQEKQINIPVPSINNSINDSEDVFTILSNKVEGVPLWVFLVTGGIIFWFMIRRRSYHSFDL